MGMHCARPRDYHGLGFPHIQFHPTKVTPLTNPAKVTDQGLSTATLTPDGTEPSKWSHQHNRSVYFPKWRKALKCTAGTITGQNTALRHS